MDQIFILKLAREALMLVLLLSAPALLIGLVVGVVISIVQAATQIQEQTLTFVPKMVAIFLTLLLSATWMMDTLVSFTIDVVSQMSNFVR